MTVIRTTPIADGTPDVFSRDNDGDGVPDALDLAPFTAVSRVFTPGDPLALRVQNLAEGVPAFVDFQIRPVNEKHLWYAYNVLDWPANDFTGHVRDVDGGTFASAMAQDGNKVPGPSDANGDIKLVPMLEIRMPAGAANLPPQADLTPYNTSVNPADRAGSEMVAYVPLSLITDEQTGQRVAFNAWMPYLPTGTWTAAHQVRLVWLVQILNDLPCDPTDPEQVNRGCSADKLIHNAVQVLQSYGDEWQLTGLNVTEDHGAKVAILYEDPTLDPDRTLDNALTALSVGLDKTFIQGRDLTGPAGIPDGKRDVDVDEMVRRFDHLTNGAVSETERWAVPNYLRAERREYKTLDAAIMSTAMTETVRILNKRFKAAWTANPEIKPLLMYAQESSSRSLSLDTFAQPGGWVTLAGTTLTMDLHPASMADGSPLLLTASLKWTPYCTPEAAEPQWSPCSTDKWWETLAARHAGPLDGDPPGDAEIEAGRTMIMNLYASVLMQGISSVEAVNGTPESAGSAPPDDSTLRDTIQAGLEKANDLVVKELTNSIMLEQVRLGSKFSYVRYMGDTWKCIQEGWQALTNFRNHRNSFRAFRVGEWLNRGGAGTLAKVGVAAGCVVAWLVYKTNAGSSVGDAAVVGVKAIAPLVGSIMEGRSLYQALSKFVKIGGFSAAAERQRADAAQNHPGRGRGGGHCFGDDHVGLLHRGRDL